MSQEINRISLRSKVKKAIQKAPYKGVFSRYEENRYHKKEEKELFTLTGVRYNNGSPNIIVGDPGTVISNSTIKFLTVWDDNSKNVKKGDYVTIDNVKYIVKETGNTFEVCLDMVIEEV